MSETKAKTERNPKGSGTTITIDLAGDVDLLQLIRDAADNDDRSASVWLRRRLQHLYAAGVLFKNE